MNKRNAFISNTYVGPNFILVSLVILAIAGLCSFKEYNILPTKWILEVVLIVSCLMTLRANFQCRFGLWALIALLYVAGNFFLMEIFNKSNLADFLLVYKAYIYIPLLMLFLNGGKLDIRLFAKVYKIILICLLLKYLYLKIFFWGGRIGDRPGLFGENNYELMTILMLYPLFRAKVTTAIRYVFIIALIVFLSESRSAMLSFVCVFVCLYAMHLSRKTVFIIMALVLFGALTFGISVLREHGGGISSIDRYGFMLIWLDQLRDFSLVNYIFGAFPITPLSDLACKKLSFYNTLFSYSGNGSCYAVILHSFNMRAIFNYGIAGFALILSIVWNSLGYTSLSFRGRLAIMSVIIINGLSVSALGSVFCAVALAIIFSVRNKHEVRKELIE